MVRERYTFERVGPTVYVSPVDGLVVGSTFAGVGGRFPPSIV
jgi:hypothetical protein